MRHVGAEEVRHVAFIWTGWRLLFVLIHVYCQHTYCFAPACGRSEESSAPSSSQLDFDGV